MNQQFIHTVDNTNTSTLLRILLLSSSFIVMRTNIFNMLTSDTLLSHFILTTDPRSRVQCTL